MVVAGRGSMCRHSRRLLVWNVPFAVERGRPFSIAVGAKCPEGCRPDDWRVDVFDHRGRRAGGQRIGPTRLDGTAALYACRPTLTAPDAEGTFEWRVAFADGRSAESNPAGAARSDARTFIVRTVARAEARLSVVVTDRESGAPVGRAKVVAHPYRESTGAEGRAELAMPCGGYRLLVSRHGYFPAAVTGELRGDALVRVELEPDPGPSDAELWA